MDTQNHAPCLPLPLIPFLDYSGTNGNCITSRRKNNNPLQLNIEINTALTEFVSYALCCGFIVELYKLLIVVICVSGDHDS